MASRMTSLGYSTKRRTLRKRHSVARQTVITQSWSDLHALHSLLRASKAALGTAPSMSLVYSVALQGFARSPADALRAFERAAASR